MATLVLSAAGSALGAAFGPFGAIAGRALGAAAGYAVDNWLFGRKQTASDGARLTTTDIQTSTEGAVIGRLFGRARVSGEIIWATRFEEEVTAAGSGGGKGGSSGGSASTEYAYYGNFAVGLVEGPVSYGVGRIWADGKEVDQTGITFRIHPGVETQDDRPR